MAESFPAGWVVQLSSPQVEEKPAARFFNVAIPDPDRAVESVKRQAGATEMDRVYAVRPLTTEELELFRLEPGEARPI